MRNMNKKDYLLISILFCFIIGFVIFLRYKGFIFGSYVDWLSQHITIPEYFRTTFYNSEQLLPLFNFNLGMGQNIFYFAYYGLLSPIILISYLLPFMQMSTFIELASIISLLVSIFLLYKWIKTKYNTQVAFLSSIIFTFAGPLIFHSHRHIMFVNYMPFLLMALMAVDNYFKTKRRLPLIISTFLIIMTSFYFSIPSIVVIGLYALYHVLQNPKINLKTFKPLFKVIFYVMISILLAGIILIPTFYVILNGRVATNVTLNILSLLNPRLDLNLTFYSAYSMGMTFIYMVALVYTGFSKKKANMFLGIILIICMFIPFVSYLLNGFMYLDGKIFIPFIPISIMLISEFLHDLFTGRINIIKFTYFLIPVMIVMIYSIIGHDNLEPLIIDIIITVVTLIIIHLSKKTGLIFIPIILINLGMFYHVNIDNERYVPTDAMTKENNEVYKDLIDLTANDYYRLSINDEVLQKVNKVYSPFEYTTTIYSSISNKNYLNFTRNIFQNEIISGDYPIVTQSSNLLFNFYSGTKYLISETPLKGYKAIESRDNLTLYQNDNVLPIGYATNKIMSLREFQTLKYPQTLDALLNYVIVDKALNNVYTSSIKSELDNYSWQNDFNLDFKYENNMYFFNAQEGARIQLVLNEVTKDDILILNFKMNKEKEGYWCSTNIMIDGITNALSCSNWKYHNQNYDFAYVLASEDTSNILNMTFTKGEYAISDFKIYKMSYQTIKNIKTTVDELIIDSKLSKDNYITGKITVKDDGYFKLTIPYEKSGFEIKVDGEKIKYQKIDTAFIGFPINQGEHTIEITYTPPFLNLGIITSLIGIVLFSLTCIYPRIDKIIDLCLKTTISALKKTFIILKGFCIKNYGFILLFFSMFILDLSLRLFYFSTINFYGWYKLIPNLFSTLWIVSILLITRFLIASLGKSFYLISYIFSLIMFLIHAIYYSYFKTYFDYSVLSMTGEGLTYLDAVLMNIKIWVILIALMSVYLTIKGLKHIHHVKKFNYLRIILIIIIFLGLHLGLPLALGTKKQTKEWDDWRKPRSVYESFNDNNKSMMVSGMYEYNWRNFYVNFFFNKNKVTSEEKTLLEEHFTVAELKIPNDYTGIFAGKNLILVQLESIDSFLITEKIMPNTYRMMQNSINFTNHYSFTSGGGSTFNSEFMVNVGYSTAYNYNQNAYAFSRNNYSYSLPNLFKSLGYSTKAFHMNSSEYYSRGANYKAFGYDKYYGLKDFNSYKNNEFWLDRELINNPTFNQEIFKEQSLSYIITYTAHMPYKTNKGNCGMLTEETGLTELECLKIQAGETDNFMGLLLENLSAREMLDDTVIVVFADHYVYTLEDQSLLDKYKNTSNNLINHTPFFIWHNNEHKKSIKSVNSQLDILPTILNLFGIEYYPNYYLGKDILDPNFEPLVFFSDGSWYNGSTYVANGESQIGKKLKDNEVARINSIVKRNMTLNDAVIKANYFSTLTKNKN